MNMSGTLYIVATPIGNLDDITFRAVEVLKSVDLIAAEDTRHTLKLLNHFGIEKPMTSYFEHNRFEKGKYLVEKLKSGENIALVSDAGTPAISDPGEDLVKLCVENGINVIPIPGASACLSALVVSGLPTGRFAFEGFLTVNKRSRSERLSELKNEKRTMIFYEAPHKLLKTLKDMYEAFGERNISISRELTKIHEETLRMKLSEAISYFSENPPKGEFVLVVEGCREENNESPLKDLSASELVKHFLEKGLSEKEAIKAAAQELGVPKREVYNEIKR
ncbi:MAG: 16S rRNA (cytidine(1402)-2'-O)-methyltransferase [Clostridiaceae bacterium]|nr:16S rRNA (cytidine(1402)-2'-O)-methyltransferase [Clostridiaceae bacterium]